MDPNHYEDLGTDTLDGKQVHVWRWSPSGTVYTLWVGDLCTVMKITIQSDRMDVTGTIVKK
jgi:hypothetical protein